MMQEKHIYKRNKAGYTIKEMMPDEQPREKLMKHGAETLSDAELIAIVLRTGTKNLNVIEASRALLQHFGGLGKLIRRNWQDVKVIPGIASVKAVTLEAVFELARRIEMMQEEEELQVYGPEELVKYFGPKLRSLQKEKFYVVFLSIAKKMLGYKCISEGGQTGTVVDPAEVFRQAISAHANSIILIHNHPSGNKRPSEMDINLTKRLINAGKLLSIPVNDHIIIAGRDYTSLVSEGFM